MNLPRFFTRFLACYWKLETLSIIIVPSLHGHYVHGFARETSRWSWEEMEFRAPNVGAWILRIKSSIHLGWFLFAVEM